MANKLKIVKGDLFTHPGCVFAHGVNCAGAMGKGIAVPFKKKWPEMYAEYHRECKEGNIIPGMAWKWECQEGIVKMATEGRLTEMSQIVIYNLATQSHWRNPASYNAIEASVNEMLADMHAHSQSLVAMPWIGCGLGGLDKSHVVKILERCLAKAEDGCDIWIYEQ